MKAAAKDLHALGPDYVLVKGGHLEQGKVLLQLQRQMDHVYSRRRLLLKQSVHDDVAPWCLLSCCFGL